MTRIVSLEQSTRYELPPEGITLLGYIVRRMHKTRWLMNIPSMIAEEKTDKALSHVAMYALTASTSFGRAYYQPRFDAPGDEIAQPDPETGVLVRAKLDSTSPTYKISYSATLPDESLFTGSEEITGTTIGWRGLGMPAPSRFFFTSGEYYANLTGILTSELALSLLGHTRIRGYGSLNLQDNTGNTGKLTLGRDGVVSLYVNGHIMELVTP